MDPISAILAALAALPSLISSVQAIGSSISAAAAAVQANPGAATQDQLAQLAAAKAEADAMNSQLASLLA